jgi:two-component system, OmpR family, sensor kinase
MSRLRRLPVRLRLTLAFALVMAAVLAATGALVFVLVRARLDRTVDHGLVSRAADVAALAEQADTGLRDAGRGRIGHPLALTQILDARGRVLDRAPGSPRRPLLAPAEIVRAHRSTVAVRRAAVAGVPGTVRLLAMPVDAQDQRLTIVVGASLAERDGALAELRAVLLLGVPAALLMASAAGYGLAAAAMRPVAAMRRNAEQISAERLDRRLPLSPARDELRDLGATLNAMLDRLAAGFERERAFAADASHELRTPLTLLRTRLELAAQTRPSGAALDATLREALADVDGLQALIEELLALARLESDHFDLHPRDHTALELLERAARRYRALTAADALRISAPHDLIVHADADRVDQALTNMVDNALRHGRPPVELVAEARDGHAVLSVRDHGAGFPDALADHAFERFARGAGAAEGGAGLGLAIVELVARSHGGTARAGNRPGGGADVSIELTRTRPAT